MDAKKNIPLIVGISIPILMILFVAASIYLPLLFMHTKPEFNFLYVTGDYLLGSQYSVENGKLVKHEFKDDEGRWPSIMRRRGDAKLFVHDVTKNESRQISFEEAQSLDLNSNIKSPDGFEIVHGSRGGGPWPFFGFSETDYNTVYIKGHNISRKLNVQQTERHFGDFHFLGWINN